MAFVSDHILTLAGLTGWLDRGCSCSHDTTDTYEAFLLTGHDFGSLSRGLGGKVSKAPAGTPTLRIGYITPWAAHDPFFGALEL